MNVYQKLIKIQAELKAPKNQYNKFGKYFYRSCEDIQEGVKPLLKDASAVLLIGDELVLVGDRYYIKATARFIDTESGEYVENSAYAREELDTKGMNAAQITGSASSYARKYALNGLFCIDDVKDADTQKPKDDNNNNSDRPKTNKITTKESEILKSLCQKKGLDTSQIFTVPIEQLTKEQYVEAVKQLEKIRKE